jgi:hypothetical protein
MVKTAYMKRGDRVDPRVRDREGEDNSVSVDKGTAGEDRKSCERCWWEEGWEQKRIWPAF